MAQKTVDISKYINNDAPQMTLFGKTYTVKNDKTTILLMNELQRKTKPDAEDTEADEKILALLVGKDEAKVIIEMLNSNPNYVENEKAVLLNVMALAMGMEYSELKARFDGKTTPSK